LNKEEESAGLMLVVGSEAPPNMLVDPVGAPKNPLVFPPPKKPVVY
jgi:hypothetical protein